MFGKMMNRYYYGKSGKGDYTKEDLPQTRWQLFWEMLRVRLSGLIRLNLMYAVAWLPAIFVIGRGLLLWYAGLANVADAQMQLEAGEITAEALGADAELHPGHERHHHADAAAAGALPDADGPLHHGCGLRHAHWARDEHAFIWSDFIDTVKGNWKYGLLTGFITGMVPLLMYVCVTIYGEMANTNLLFMIPQAICIMVGVLWLCSLMYVYPQIVTYKLNYRNVLRNSLIMTIGRLPMTVGLKLLSLLPWVIAALVALFTPYMQYALMGLAVYYIVIGFGLSRFVGASYSNAVFDRYINPNIEGAQVGRGLYNAQDDEDEEDGGGEAGE